MENAEVFEQWLAQMLKDSKDKLGMTDKTIAYILLREGTAYYFRTITSDKTSPEHSKIPK